MGAVKFYHLRQHGLEEVALSLVKGAMAQGWRVMIRSPEPAWLSKMDGYLWRHEPASFLAHGLEGAKDAARQPILLGAGAPVNGAQAVVSLAGAELDLAEAASMARLWVLFESQDDGQMAQARTAWRAVLAAGVTAEYWSDETGSWVLKHQAAPRAQAGASGGDI